MHCASFLKLNRSRRQLEPALLSLITSAHRPHRIAFIFYPSKQIRRPNSYIPVQTLIELLLVPHLPLIPTKLRFVSLNKSSSQKDFLFFFFLRGTSRATRMKMRFEQNIDLFVILNRHPTQIMIRINCTYLWIICTDVHTLNKLSCSSICVRSFSVRNVCKYK